MELNSILETDGEDAVFFKNKSPMYVGVMLKNCSLNLN
jgi:hypothetical protein